MKRDHWGFAIFLIFLLLAPRIPLGGIAGLPARTAFSLGIFGLLIWGLLSPSHLLRLKFAPRWTPLLLLLLFAGYALLVSWLAFSLVAVAYATQYLLYLLLGYLLISGYVTRAKAEGELATAGNILALISGIFSLGAIISMKTGPLYPHEVQWAAKRWGGFYIQQGVGFAEGTNMAGAILIVLCSALWLGWRKRGSLALLAGILAGAALLGTISRGAILGMVIGLAALGMLLVLRAALRQRMSRKSLQYGVLLLLIILVIAFGLQALLSFDGRGLTGAIARGFGIGGPNLLESESARRETWQSSWENWREGDIRELVLGKGFRGSQTIHEYGTWQTAHNLYLSILGDFGIVGLLLFLSGFGVFLRRTGKNILLSGGSSWEKAALVGGVGLLAHNMTETFLYSPALIGLWLLLLALAAVTADSGD